MQSAVFVAFGPSPPITITALPVDWCFFCSLTPFAVAIIVASCRRHHFHHWLIVFVLHETFRCGHHSQVLPPPSSPLLVDFFCHFYSWTHFAVCHHSQVLPPLLLPPLVDCCFLAPCKLFNGHHHHVMPPPSLPLLVDCFFLAPGTDGCGIISTSYWHHHCHHRLIVFLLIDKILVTIIATPCHHHHCWLIDFFAPCCSMVIITTLCHHNYCHCWLIVATSGHGNHTPRPANTTAR